MNSFRGLAQVQQATLATVAPGIAEALIAASDRSVRRNSGGDCLQPLRLVAMLIGRYYTFADEFQAILHRKVHTTED